MATQIDIYNRALQKLGAKRVASLSEDSRNRKSCDACYEHLRDSLLEDHDWNFAIKRAELAASGTSPDWGRAYEFPLPSDFIRLTHDYAEDNSPYKDWQIEGTSLFTDESDPIYVRYIYRVAIINNMSSLFREALSTLMAFEMCEEITQSNTKKAALESDLEKVLRKAKKSNAFQSVSQEFPNDTWITERD